MKVLKHYQLPCDVEFDLRLPTEQDVPFITNAWLREYRSSPSTKGLSDGKYFYTQHSNIQKHLRHDNALVLVACDTDNPDVIYGFVVADRSNGTIHWVHVKNKFRRFGIGRTLTEVALHASGATEAQFTHHTRHSEHLLKYASFSYNPPHWIKVNEQANQPKSDD